MANESSFLIEIVLKRCCACGLEKPHDQFHKRAASKDGLQPRCIPCGRDWGNAHRRRPDVQAKRKERVEKALDQPRICACCGQTKLGRDFYRNARRADGLSHWCKRCVGDARPIPTAEELVQRQRRDADRARAFRELIEQSKDTPCSRCGERFPVVCMDFHHRDPATKFKGVAVMSRCSLDRVRAEIAKCDVLCANCHRIVEFGNG